MPHHILKTFWHNTIFLFPQAYSWLLELLKVEWEAEPSAQDPSPVEPGRQKDTLFTLKLRQKLFFLINFIVGAELGDPEPSLSHAATGCGCWGTS